MEAPEVLILDEPFNALDSDSVMNVKRILREEHDKGTTIIFTSHMRQDVDDLSTDVLEIDNRHVRVFG
jgi:ABC-2 type transport system ATP-binding protein